MSLRSKGRDALVVCKLIFWLLVLSFAAGLLVLAYRVFVVILMLGLVAILGWVVFQMIRGSIRSYDRRKAWRVYREDYAAWEAASAALTVAESSGSGELAGQFPQQTTHEIEAAAAPEIEAEVLVLAERPEAGEATFSVTADSPLADASAAPPSLTVAAPQLQPEVSVPDRHVAEPIKPQAEPRGPRNAMATAGFVLGIITAACCVLWFPVALDPIVAVPAIVFAGLGLRRARQRGVGEAKSWIGLGLGVLGVLVWILQAFLYMK